MPTDSGIRIPMSCIAELITSPGRSRDALLRPYKFKNQGEGLVRVSYYQRALQTIRKYHSAGNDPAILDRSVREMRESSEETPENRKLVKLRRNISAVEAYRRIYGNRKFDILSIRRLEYPLGGVIVTARPDLWVKEGNSQVLLKIGMAKHGPSYIDMLLCLLRKAAVRGGYRIRAKNIVYLDVSTGRERISSGPLTRFNPAFKNAAQQISATWSEITTEK